jgi:hypothetical protein
VVSIEDSSAPAAEERAPSPMHPAAGWSEQPKQRTRARVAVAAVVRKPGASASSSSSGGVGSAHTSAPPALPVPYLVRAVSGSRGALGMLDVAHGESVGRSAAPPVLPADADAEPDTPARRPPEAAPTASGGGGGDTGTAPLPGEVAAAAPPHASRSRSRGLAARMLEIVSLRRPQPVVSAATPSALPPALQGGAAPLALARGASARILTPRSGGASAAAALVTDAPVLTVARQQSAGSGAGAVGAGDSGSPGLTQSRRRLQIVGVTSRTLQPRHVSAASPLASGGGSTPRVSRGSTPRVSGGSAAHIAPRLPAHFAAIGGGAALDLDLTTSSPHRWSVWSAAPSSAGTAVSAADGLQAQAGSQAGNMAGVAPSPVTSARKQPRPNTTVSVATVTRTSQRSRAAAEAPVPQGLN